MKERQMKKDILMGRKAMRKAMLALLITITVLGVSGCGKKAVCDFCGDTKTCTEKSVFGEKINICKDCQKEMQ